MKRIVLTSLIVVVIGAIAVFIIPGFFKTDLKDTLAKALNTDPDNLILNLPPSPGRFPGTVLMPHKDGYLSYFQNSNSQLLEGPTFDLTTKITTDIISNSNGSAGILDHVFSNMDHFDVDLIIKDGHILEITIPEIKELMQGLDIIKDAINKRKNLIVLHKAVEGIISYDIRAKDEKGVEILANTKQEAKALSQRNEEIKVQGSTSNNQLFSFAMNIPVIFAFEALSVNYVVNNLGGEDLDVVLEEVTQKEIDEMSKQNTFDLPKKVINSDVTWGLITIGSAHFSDLATWDVPEAIKSLEVVKSTLEKYEPTFSKQLISTPDQVITEDVFFDWTIDFTTEMLSQPVDYLIIYYTGHGLSLPNGELALLTGNAKKDFAENAKNAMTPQTSQLDDGILLAETIYNSFEICGIPFTIFIDACYPNNEMQEALNFVSMEVDEDGSNMVYHGNEDFITSEMDIIHDTQYDMGQRFSYRTNFNPIIFSTKPGAKAILKPDPISYYNMKVTPIAERILQFEPTILSLNEFIQNTIDNKGGLGEISLYGTISWSELDSMEAYTSGISYTQN